MSTNGGQSHVPAQALVGRRSSGCLKWVLIVVLLSVCSGGLLLMLRPSDTWNILLQKQSDVPAPVEPPSQETTPEAIFSEEVTPSQHRQQKVSAPGTSHADKAKKPMLFNKLDKGIRAELEAAEGLRKKGKIEEAVKAFDDLVKRYPNSPRARYGKAQAQDDLAEKLRSNELLLNAIALYGEVAVLPDVPSDLLRLTLRRQADRYQFMGRMRLAMKSLKILTSMFPDDLGLLNDLGVAYLLLGDNKAAKTVYEQILVRTPNDGLAQVHYGFILKAENQINASIPYLQKGIESGASGTDDGRFYFHLGDALQRAGRLAESYIWYERGHKRGHFLSVLQRSLYNVNNLQAQPWWTTAETGYTSLVRALEKGWHTIRDEALAVVDKQQSLFLSEDENLRKSGNWKQFTLWQQGRRNEKSCLQTPRTCAIMERFPESVGCTRGQVKFSIMQPGTHVWPHTGPTNCRLRLHLGLVIPPDGCSIRCGNETRYWEEGKVLIFDDSFEHEVWQDAQSYRLIFIVDVWHPGLTTHQRRTLSPI
uniref:Un-named hu7910 n=1 Tax=Eptatretus burgeri TaxID=7764 RepID=A0A8C4PWA3_EPTBU